MTYPAYVLVFKGYPIANEVPDPRTLPAWLSAPTLSRFRDLGIFSGSHETSKPSYQTLDVTCPVNSSFLPPTPHGLPNHCLINEYMPGQGIMPHEDGSAYAPVVATVSLGSHTVLEIYEKRGVGASSNLESKKPVARILQEPRSLLLTSGSAYTDLLHGIADNILVDEKLGPLSNAEEGVAEGISNWDLLSDTTKENVASEGSRLARGTRVSLTFRDVMKVNNIATKFGFSTR